MQIAPDNEHFAGKYDAGKPQVVYTRLVADLETPVSAFMKLTRNAPYRFLLESVEGGAVRGRYSMIGMKPDLIWRVNGDKAEINTRASIDPDGPFVELDEPPLTSLRSLLAANHIDVPDDLPPMAAGLFGYMGYDLVRQMERLPEPNEDVLHVPDALMIRPTAKDYIKAGDIFQVVLSQRFETPFPLPDFALYRALRRTNPAPFLYYLAFDGFTLVGSSPEILVRVRDGEVTIRPIAGTRKRGETPQEDEALADELLADPKERAEHLMLLDLGRNDVGRVSKLGTVKVTDQFFIERYSQVMHIVSNVIGELDSERYDALDALGAGFPAGTVSGAPKVRAMEIIDELEKHKRGIYAGCVGYFDANGALDTCIVLRTAIVKDGVMYVQAGAGIVADSDPDSEQAECENKARALFRAAEEAVRFAGRAGKGQ
jgi:anthranilate/para-aminobenzoate synthase component I